MSPVKVKFFHLAPVHSRNFNIAEYEFPIVIPRPVPRLSKIYHRHVLSAPLHAPLRFFRKPLLAPILFQFDPICSFIKRFNARLKQLSRVSSPPPKLKEIFHVGESDKSNSIRFYTFGSSNYLKVNSNYQERRGGMDGSFPCYTIRGIRIRENGILTGISVNKRRSDEDPPPRFSPVEKIRSIFAPP